MILAQQLKKGEEDAPIEGDAANIEGVDLVLGSEHKFNLLQHIEKINLNNNISVNWSEIEHVNHFKAMKFFSSWKKTEIV